MRLDRTAAGDFRVYDDQPFTAADIIRAETLILKHYKVRTLNWPLTIDFNEKAGLWEIWVTRPATDEEYVAYLEHAALE